MRPNQTCTNRLLNSYCCLQQLTYRVRTLLVCGPLVSQVTGGTSCSTSVEDTLPLLGADLEGPVRSMDDKYGTGAKGLNTSGGTNRFKFQGKQARAKLVDVDVAHKVRAEGYLDADKAQEPDVEGGSFFQQELDRSKELNVTPPFKRFYYKVQ